LLRSPKDPLVFHVPINLGFEQMIRKQKVTLASLASTIVGCEKCPRLRNYCEIVGKTKRKAYSDWDYWKKPLPGFGDPSAEVLIVGLAPAANGGTRTGRLFCGDSSGDWLTKALYETGFANQPSSTSRNDGLELSGAYLSAVARCAPPENKPTQQEIGNCLPYLAQELRLLKNVRVIMALGNIALQGVLQMLTNEFGAKLDKKPKFIHGSRYEIADIGLILYVSYHPSRRNTQTKFMTWPMWISTFREIRKELERQNFPETLRIVA
jgi:uracil-DNA glycosylase